MLSCIGEFVADIDMAMAAQQLMQLSGEDDGADESVSGTRSTAGNSSCGGKKRKRSEKVASKRSNEDNDEVVVLMMAPRRVKKYRSLDNLYMLTKPI